MSEIDDLTVCVTTFRRPERLARCIESAKAAGVSKIVVCDGEEYGGDLGCNNTWMVAAYRATTKRVLLLHDDDSLSPDFGKAYREIIKPCLDKRDAGFASWDAEIRHDDGHTEPCPYWQGAAPLVMKSDRLRQVINSPGCLTHSPVVSVLNRSILIRACKEAAENLITSPSLERPGMLLGTEILVYLRHCEAFKRWLHVPQVLAYYGYHEGSGTVKAQRANETERLMRGYDLARLQGRHPAPMPSPRLILVHSAYTPKDEKEQQKQARAQESWKFHFSNADMIDLPMVTPEMPKVGECLDYACKFALPEDIVVYANADAGLTTHAAERIIEGIAKGRGVTSCGNRVLDPEPGRAYKSVTNCRIPGGTEVVAMTPQWWGLHRDKMPDMFIGREGWDTVFNALAEDWADGPGDVIVEPDEWLRSRAHTDNVCWHQEHFSQWQADRLGIKSESQRHNREATRAFFTLRGDARMMEMLK